MRDITQAIQNRDARTLAHIANQAPQAAKQEIPPQAIEIFNILFRQLQGAKPAMMHTIKSQEQLDEVRRQYLKAIVENEIYHTAQIEAGMTMVRKQESPFLPSPGQFVAWCKAGAAAKYGLPTAEELFKTVMSFRANRYKYSTAEDYPWRSKTDYWMVTAVSAAMTARLLTESEAITACSAEISRMASRIGAGEEIPEPVAQIERKPIVSSPEKRAEYLAQIKAKFRRSSAT